METINCCHSLTAMPAPIRFKSCVKSALWILLRIKSKEKPKVTVKLLSNVESGLATVTASGDQSSSVYRVLAAAIQRAGITIKVEAVINEKAVYSRLAISIPVFVRESR